MMTTERGRFSYPRLRFLLLVMCAVSGTVLAAGAFGLRVNVTASLPVGLYLATSDANAALVEFCPAEPFAAESRDRNYRPKSIACPDGAAPLVKPIAARPGDTVLVTDKGIVVNGKQFPHSAALELDGAGRKLKPWLSGTYAVAPNELWVVSTYRGSYDSRYMGPIRRDQVGELLMPMWVIE